MSNICTDCKMPIYLTCACVTAKSGELKAGLEEAQREEGEDMRVYADSLKVRAEQAEVREQRLREALARYGAHLADCSVEVWAGEPVGEAPDCTCGFSPFLRLLEGGTE